MAERTTGHPSERRRTPRVNCRLHGCVTRGRERIRVRIVDISEGGLCLLSPIWLNPKQPVKIAIEVPGRGPSAVQVEIWHIRREKSRSSSGKIWIAGAILRDRDQKYAQLLEAAGLAVAQPVPESRPAVAHPATRADALELDSVEPRIFRLRCKARGGPRTRVLTLAADSEEAARKLAERDLGADWDVLEVLEA